MAGDRDVEQVTDRRSRKAQAAADRRAKEKRELHNRYPDIKGLSTRAFNTLMNLDLTTSEAVRDLGWEGLEKKKGNNFGDVTLEEIAQHFGLEKSRPSPSKVRYVVEISPELLVWLRDGPVMFPYADDNIQIQLRLGHRAHAEKYDGRLPW